MRRGSLAPSLASLASLAPLVVALGLGACGDSGGDASSGSETAASASSGGSATAASTTAASATTTATTAAASESGTDTTTSGADVWMTPYCYLASDGKWLAAWIDLEDEVLARINDVRAKGTTCGAAGPFAAAPALTREDHLRCAARVHAQDMNDRAYLDHVNPDGEGPGDRVDETGYATLMVGENIAGGPDNAADAVAGWLASDEHCAILMSPNWKTTGVGFYEGEGPFTFYWTQTFALPK